MSIIILYCRAFLLENQNVIIHLLSFIHKSKKLDH